MHGINKRYKSQWLFSSPPLPPSFSLSLPPSFSLSPPLSLFFLSHNVKGSNFPKKEIGLRGNDKRHNMKKLSQVTNTENNLSTMNKGMNQFTQLQEDKKVCIILHSHSHNINGFVKCFNMSICYPAIRICSQVLYTYIHIKICITAHLYLFNFF